MAKDMSLFFDSMAKSARNLVGEVLSPTRCVACERPGKLLCDTCRSEIVRIDPEKACRVCGAPFGFLQCTECGAKAGAYPYEGSSLDRVLAASVFGHPVDRMIIQYKDSGERRMSFVIAKELEWAAIANDLTVEKFDMLCFIPATPSAFRRRGFDHMELVARELSSLIGIPLKDALTREHASDQRDLSKEERFANCAAGFKVVECVRDMRVLLIDDVVTTGASMAGGAHALKESGAAEVTGLALARVWGVGK